MKIALLSTDSREHFRNYSVTTPAFGTAPEALIEGFASLPEAEVHVISCAQQPMQSPEKLAPNIWYHTLHVPKSGWMRTLYQGCVRAVRKKLREIRPDIVHGQGTERDCALAAVFSGFPNVVTIHGNMAELARMFHTRVGSYHWLAARLENFTLPRTAGIFCNSTYTENLVQPRAKKTWRVPNALRGEFFSVIPGGLRPPVLLNVGVITERKRQLELLDVAEELRRRGLKFEFHFIGRLKKSEPYAAAFCEKLKPLVVAGCARHLGEFPAPELMRRFDAAGGLVHFPSEESFGLVVAEALARNLRIFGSRVGGIADITAGASGVELFDANDWNGLTEAIARWLERGRPPANSGAAMMRERYHPTVIAKSHLEIYREVLGNKR